MLCFSSEYNLGNELLGWGWPALYKKAVVAVGLRTAGAMLPDATNQSSEGHDQVIELVESLPGSAE